MNTKSVYVDELHQSFVADGNVFLRFLVVSGEIDASGKDLRREAITLIVPTSRISQIAKNMSEAALACGGDRLPQPDQQKQPHENFLGPPLEIK